MITFYRSKPFVLEVFYSDLTSLPFPEAKIGENQGVFLQAIAAFYIADTDTDDTDIIF